MKPPKTTTGEVRPDQATETQATAPIAGTGPAVATAQKDHVGALSSALEMARELKEAKERHSVLAAQIERLLRPADLSGDCSEPSAWRLAEVLDELLGDFGQSNRLVATLQGICQNLAVDYE